MNFKNNKNLSDSETKLIAESSNNLRIELIKKIGSNDRMQIIELSKQLKTEFGEDALISNNNVDKYFNRSTFPFIARVGDKIVGFIIGAPLEYFSRESWSHYDTNLGKKNTIYTYLFLVNSLYRKKTGYSKILKMIYINWCKKNNFSFVTGHVRLGIAKQFSDNTEIVKIFSKWYSAKTPFEYYRRPLK